MLSFLTFVGVALLCYLAWRIMDMLPDTIFRLSEIQRDIADIRRKLTQEGGKTADTNPKDD